MEKIEGSAQGLTPEQYAELAEFGLQIEKAEQDLLRMQEKIDELKSLAAAARTTYELQVRSEDQMLEQYGAMQDPSGELQRTLADSLAGQLKTALEQMQSADDMVRIM